jgi:hypothetical protein
MADGVWTLPPMAQGRPLAADNGSAPPLPMMQTAHSRDRSGTVGLEGKFCEVCTALVLHRTVFLCTEQGDVAIQT